MIVDDVNAFPGHIACDSASRSEIVLPLLRGDSIFGVFDVDSPEPARFGPQDRAGLERLVARYMEFTRVPEQYRTQAEGSVHIAERIDIQTCRDHHVVLKYLSADITGSQDAAKTSELFFRFKTVMLAHLRLEDTWLYPRLAQSSNDIVREKAHRYQTEMGSLRQSFVELWERWSASDAIASNPRQWSAEWQSFVGALERRVHAEDDDLYVAAETDLSEAGGWRWSRR